jgi:hypothetical protein
MNGKHDWRKSLIAATVFLGLFMAGASLYGQQTFGATVYFDYTSYLSSKGPRTAAPADTKGFMDNYFAFRRAYFTYENKISDNLKFRFRTDADTVKALDKSGKADDKTRPFLKHLYLEWSNLIPKSTIKIGMADTFTFKLAEDRWGYRSVAKTLLDSFKDVTGKDIDASSADLGVSLSGTISKELRYAVQVTNGAGYSKPEGDGYKKLMTQVQVVPLAGLSLVGYMDYEKQTTGENAYTYKGDVYLEMVKGLVVGAEYFAYASGLNKTASGLEYKVSGLSVFGRYSVVPDKLNAFARYDRYEPNSRASNDRTSLAIAGLDWAPVPASFRLQPNVWYYTYEDSAKKDDVVFNLTFFLSF